MQGTGRDQFLVVRYTRVFVPESAKNTPLLTLHIIYYWLLLWLFP